MEKPDISKPQFPVVQTGHPTFEHEVLGCGSQLGYGI